MGELVSTMMGRKQAEFDLGKDSALPRQQLGFYPAGFELLVF